MLKKTNTNAKKSSAFKKGVLIYSVALTLIIAALLCVLWTYLDSYQQSLPRAYAENHVANMDSEDIREAFVEALDGKCVYETEEEAADALVTLLLKDGELRARKDATNSTADVPVFNIFCGKNCVAKLCLKRTANGAYGFERWQAEKPQANAEILDLLAKKKTLTVPAEAILSINGHEAPKTLGVETEDPFCSPLETASDLKFLKYEITMPYCTDDISVSLGEKTLIKAENDEYDYPAEARITTVVNAPIGASVFINGLKLPESYIKENDIDYPFLSELESKLADRLKSNVWAVEKLTHAPEIKVIHNGRELKESRNENGVIYFIGNDIEFKDYTLFAPKGAIVTVNGIDITDEYIVSRDSLYPEIKEYSSLLVNPITNTKYSFKGLTRQPEIKVTYDRQEINVRNEGEVFTCKAAPPAEDIPMYEEKALNFTKTLMLYMFGGRDGIGERISDALAYTKHESDAYNKILDTYSGMYYRKKMEITYNTLYVDDYVSYAENAFYCVVHYDVFGQSIETGKTDKAAGEYKLTFIKDGDNWLLYHLLLY